ncbi:MAG TPA: DUF4214 domain-containing protein [Stellaceae bacterium]|nr:DUF4214 domain-containing protein [Stellaceae bacterium]
MVTSLEFNEIASIYEDVLFRAPDTGGLAYWSGLLDTGAQSLTQITNDIVGSAEAIDIVDPIVRLYEGLFGRAPDFAGLQYWVGLADSGTNFDTVVRDFVGSQEFANDYNGGVIAPIAQGGGDAFVTALYQHFLDRAPDVGGLNHWLHVLGTPTVASEAAVIEGFVNSAEYIADAQNAVTAYEANGAAAGLASTSTSWVGDGGVEVVDIVDLGHFNPITVLEIDSNGSVFDFEVSGTGLAPADIPYAVNPNDKVTIENTVTTVDLSVTGDFTGATSAAVTGNTLPDSLAHETIDWLGSNLNLTFGNEPNEALAGGSWSNSQVNVGTATSLAAALDMAAGQAVILDQTFAGGQNTTVMDSEVELNARTGLVDWFQYGGNTYIVEANNDPDSAAVHGALGPHDVVVELTGLVDPSAIGFNQFPPPQSPQEVDFSGPGFGTVTIPEYVGASYFIAGGTGNGGSVDGATYDDGGYAVDTLNVSAGDNTNSYDNLNNSSLLEIGTTLNPTMPTGDAVTNGNVVVTQVGTDPTLTVEAIENVHLSTLDVDSGSTDPLLVFYIPIPESSASPPPATMTVDSLIDPGATIAILGTSSLVDLASITDPALSMIDASGFSGGLELGTAASPLSQSGLTILAEYYGGTPGVAIFASGDGDVITIGNAEMYSEPVKGWLGPVTVEADGTADQISVDLGGGAGALVGAAAAGDTLTLMGGGLQTMLPVQTAAGIAPSSEVVSGVIAAAGNEASAYDLAYAAVLSEDDSFAPPGAPPVGDSPLGANDTINIGDLTNTIVTRAVAWLGANDTVTVGGNTVANLWLTGDVTGATSAVVTGDTLPAALVHETIDYEGGALILDLFNESVENWAGGSWSDSQVNVTVATSLANALDMAAGQIVSLAQNDDSAIGISGSQIDAQTGLLDWFQYGGNTYIVEANNDTAAAATHTALGTHDAVIEVIGLNTIPGVATHFG